MEELTMGVNWWAVGAGTVLSFMLGSLWYSKMLFGEKWAEAVGVETGDGATQPVPALIVQFIGTFLLAWLIAITAASGTLLLPILIAVTVTALIGAASLFGNNSRYAAIVEGGFVIAMAAIMLACQAIVPILIQAVG